jgi:cytoskeletal protein CcmA (bactofilin family)
MALFKRDPARGHEGINPGIDLDRGRNQSVSPGASGAIPEEQQRKGLSMGSYTAAAEKLPAGENSQPNAFLGRGTRITGKVAFDGTARIEGHVEGEVVATDTLLVGESAVLNAQISGAIVIINGKVTGDITASKKLEILAPGRVYGNVITPSLVIEEGVVFEGHCSMGAAENKADRKVTLLAKEEKASEPIPPIALKVQADSK